MLKKILSMFLPLNLVWHKMKQVEYFKYKLKSCTYRKLFFELDRCIKMPINITRYDNVATVSYQQNFADIYRECLLIKATTRRYVIVLHGMFRNPNCHFISDWLLEILCPVLQIL